MNLNVNWRVIVVGRAKKQLKKLPREYLGRIGAAIDGLEIGPSDRDAVKLEGYENSWRKRVGDYRIIYEILPKERIILVNEVKRRTSSTY